MQVPVEAAEYSTEPSLRPGPPLAEAAGAPLATPDAVDAPGETPKRRRVTKKRLALGALALAVLFLGSGYTQKDRYSDQFADLSREVFGDRNTSRLEAFYFRMQDKLDQVKFKVFGGSTNPFDESTVFVQVVDPPQPRNIFIDLANKPDLRDLSVSHFFKPRPMEPPKTTALRDNPEAGEGVWTTTALPRATPEDMLMAKTFIRPDKSRPYALVGMLLLDSRRIRLHLVGGTVDPGGDRGVRGAGVIPTDDQKNLLAAFTGGFKGPHGGFGMLADGKEYRPLRNGLASIAVFKDGTMKMGEWGRSLTWDDNMAAVRQNAILLVDNCEVNKRTAEGNDTWGYVVANSQEFITWRSAVGLTKDGYLLLAAGNSLSAQSLANALWAAGACTAMQLDINTPYVLTTTYHAQPDGSMKAQKFMDTMPGNANRYLSPQERDFFYVTIDETRFR
jgi:hypothetical protein